MANEKLDQVDFVNNPEPRCPVVLLLDTSSSMQGQPIAELNDALKEFDKTLKADKLASLRVELAIITFGGTVRAIDVKEGEKREIPFDADQAFVTADNFHPPVLETDGLTPLGEAVRRAISLLRDRKDIYKRNAIDYFRPWILLITDGAPTDEGWELAAEQASEEEARKGFICYAVGVAGADMQTLGRFSKQRKPLKLQGLAFQELFQWLSKSLSAVAQSRPGEQVPLPAVGWAQADTSR